VISSLAVVILSLFLASVYSFTAAALVTNPLLIVGLAHLALKAVAIVIRAVNYFVKTYWKLSATWKYFAWSLLIFLTFVIYSLALFALSCLIIWFVLIGTIYIFPLVIPDLLKSMSGYGHLQVWPIPMYFKYEGIVTRAKQADLQVTTLANPEIEDPEGVKEETWAAFFREGFPSADQGVAAG